MLAPPQPAILPGANLHNHLQSSSMTLAHTPPTTYPLLNYNSRKMMMKKKKKNNNNNNKKRHSTAIAAFLDGCEHRKIKKRWRWQQQQRNIAVKATPPSSREDGDDDDESHSTAASSSSLSSSPSSSSGILPQFSGDNTATKITLGLLWAAYMWFVLLTPNAPGSPATSLDPHDLTEAIQLSINFWFVTPILLPQLAPVIHPAFEGLFETLVTWSVLYFGFITEGRSQKKGVSTLGFLIGSSFLTNIFFIPYLALRTSAPSLSPRQQVMEVEEEEQNGAGINDVVPFEDRVENIVENKYFGVTVGSMAAFSIFWGLFARPEYGDLSQRGADFLQILKNDRLAYSFLVDMGIFALLQSWMVNITSATTHNNCNYICTSNIVVVVTLVVVAKQSLIIYRLTTTNRSGDQIPR